MTRSYTVSPGKIRHNDITGVSETDSAQDGPISYENLNKTYNATVCLSEPPPPCIVAYPPPTTVS